MRTILLAFYGDDFTGSTDALEFICRAGAKAMLFIEPPTAEKLLAYPELNAFGVAGKTRSLSTAEMREILVPAFQQISLSGARHVHYKVCSTFDSSADIGSIGQAIDCGASVFKNKLIPVLGGTPALARYCVFGNLFARLGTGNSEKIYRLDRHPSMSKHPVTPATESDLRLHLGAQTNKKIGLIDIIQLGGTVADMNSKNEDAELILIDALQEDQLLKIGQWIDGQYAEGNSLFSVGSSAIEMALGKSWNQSGLLQQVVEWPSPGIASPLLVVSGSRSPVTLAQIEWARNNGFEEIILDISSQHGQEDEPLQSQVNSLLEAKKNVIVHTGQKNVHQLSSEKLGTALGLIVKNAAESKLIKRVVIAGGDTSSYAARAMEIEAVEMIAPLVPGAPLCLAISSNPFIQGLEVNFKGGQVGGEDYFLILKEGK